MSKKERIEKDYQTLRELCAELDHQYYQSSDPEVGFKVGHYDDDRQEIQFYSIQTHQIDRLKEELNKAVVDNENGLMEKYEFYQSFVYDDSWLVLIRPRLLN